MKFELPVIQPKIKIGYTMERVEQFIPNPLRCYKCQKYGHQQDNVTEECVWKMWTKTRTTLKKERKNTQMCKLLLRIYNKLWTEGKFPD